MPAGQIRKACGGPPKTFSHLESNCHLGIFAAHPTPTALAVHSTSHHHHRTLLRRNSHSPQRHQDKPDLSSNFAEPERRILSLSDQRPHPSSFKFERAHSSFFRPRWPLNMSYYNQGYGQNTGGGASNLQFYPSSYSNVSGHTTPSQASYGGYSSGNTAPAYSGYGAGSSAAFGGGPGMQGVSGRMGETGGLRTGWLAAFGTEGYEGEPGLMEELGVNFGHIKTKVSIYSLEHEGCQSHVDTMLL